MTIDYIDKQLLNLLQDNAKLTNKALSLKLNLSVTAVHERIKKLERNGFIEAYVALVDKKKIDKNFIVFCQVRLSKHSNDYVVQFESEVSALDEVVACYHISGDYDYLIKVVTQDMESYRAFVVNKLTVISHVSHTHSSFVIKSVKQSSGIKL